MRQFLLRIVGCLLGLTVACSSEPAEESSLPTNFDAQGAIETSLMAMEELTSYRQEFTFRPSGAPFTLLADYSDTGDYYERLLETEGVTETFEVILLGESTYTRNCDDYPDSCEEWEEEAGRPVMPRAGGFTTVGPETLGLTAVEQADSPKAIGTDEINGEQAIRLRGFLNIGRTVYENQRRGLAPSERFSETCTQTECKDLTLEEYYEREVGGTDFEDVPSTTIDIWLSPEDSLVRRVVIARGKLSTGDEEIPETDRYFEVSYSRFNEAPVEAPE